MTSDWLKINSITELQTLPPPPSPPQPPHPPTPTLFGLLIPPSSVNELNPKAVVAPSSLHYFLSFASAHLVPTQSWHLSLNAWESSP